MAEVAMVEAANDRLGQLGNWPGLIQKAAGITTLNQARVHNKVNEIDTNDVDSDAAGASITASTGANWVDPTYDKAGNMTLMPQPAAPTSSFTLKYDAWNRLVEVKAGASLIQTNEYDGLGRRIRKDLPDQTDDLDYYYNEEWQLLEERKNGDPDPLAQYVWHPYYIDTLAIRYYDENLDGTSVEHYYAQDANFNVTAVADNAGGVLERYAYSPYGEVTVLDANFAADADGLSDIGNTHLYTGRERDAETGLQLNRNRFYAWHLGRWVNRDPIGFLGGSRNLYEYIGGGPANDNDAYGLIGVRWVCHRHRQQCQFSYPRNRNEIMLVTCTFTWECCSTQLSKRVLALIMLEAGYPCCAAGCIVSEACPPVEEINPIARTSALLCMQAAFLPLIGFPNNNIVICKMYRPIGPR